MIIRQNLNRLWIVVGAVNVRVKILGMVLGLVVLLGVTVTVQVRSILARNMIAQLEEQSISVAHDLAARSTDLILINDAYALHELLYNTQTNNANVRYLFIVSPDGEILDHTFGEGFPPQLLEANSMLVNEDHRTRLLITDEGKVWDTAVPIFEGQAGTARVGISDDSVRQTVNSVTGQLLLTTLLVSAIGVTAATALTWVLTRPILQLVQATQAVGQGDFSQRVPRWANDEIGDLAEAFNAMTHQLEQAAQERAERDHLRDKYVSGVIKAQEEERKRIARELHDSTSQTLTSLMIGLRALSDNCQYPDNCPYPDIRARAEELRNVAAKTLDEVHTLAFQLRPSVLDDLGLPEALQRHIADCRHRYSFNIDLAIHGLEQRLPPDIETALYRITQEALTNISRHAHAETASVFVERREDKVIAIIDDDGSGFDLPEIDRNDGHLGLYGIRERVELLSGKLEIESEPGMGTSLFIEIPLRA
jgi:signal transduction histidine kinase